MTVHRLGFVLAVRAIAAPPVSMLGCVQATMIAPAVSHTACSPPAAMGTRAVSDGLPSRIDELTRLSSR